MFFAEAVHSFESASEATGTVERSFLIADTLVSLHFAGTAMEGKISRPFEHLEVELPRYRTTPPLPTLKVLIWDSASTKTPALRPPWTKEEFTPLGQVIPCRSGRFRAVYEADGRLLSMVDLTTNTAVYWARDGRDIPFHVRATPLRAILSAWLSSFGWEFAHAAAVGNRDGAVIIAGHGGAGKSSTAMMCLEAGLSYLSDDYCLVSSGAAPRVGTVYSTGKVMAADRPLYSTLPPVAESIYCADADKHLFFLTERAAGRECSSVPLTAIVLPRIRKEQTRVRLATPREAFVAIAESSASLFPYSPASAIRVFGDLSRRIPAYCVELGPDRRDAVRVIKELLESQPVQPREQL